MPAQGGCLIWRQLVASHIPLGPGDLAGSSLERGWQSKARSDTPLTPSPTTDTVPRTEMELQSLRQEAEELRKKIKVMAGGCMNDGSSVGANQAWFAPTEDCVSPTVAFGS